MDTEFRPILKTEQSGFDWWSGVYHTDLEGLRVKLIFERMSDGENGAIWCEARALVMAEDEIRTVIPPSRTNLMNATRGGVGWKGLAATLSDMARSIAWDEAVAQGVERAIEVYRTGEQEKELRYQKLTLGNPFLLEPFIASTGVSVFFGEGGTGKSLIALSLAVAVAGNYPIFGKYPRQAGPVMYFDYEDDSEVHEERLAAILKSIKIELEYPIYHRKLIAKVSQSQATMRRSIGERGAVLAVLDSIGMGRGGNANTAEDTIRLFRALRSLDVPTLAIDHVNKEDKRSGETVSPYGSVYTINSARLLWGAVIAPGLTSEDKKYLNLQNTKANRTALSPPMGMAITYHNREDDVHNTRWLGQVDFEVFDKWWASKEPDTFERIRHYLGQHPEEWYSIRELVMLTNLSQAAIEKALQRNKRALQKKKRGREFVYALIPEKNNVIQLELGDRE